MFACAAELFARLRKLRYEGIAIARRIPRMMITTRSSISVKPSSLFRRFLRAVMVVPSVEKRSGSFPATVLDRLTMNSASPSNEGCRSARAEDALAAADGVAPVDDRGVAAGAAEHEVAAAVAGLDPVVPGAAVEPVGLASADDAVVAGVAVEALV